MFESQPDEERSQDLGDWGFGKIEAQEAVFSTLRQVLAPRELPCPETLSDMALISLLNEIEFELLQSRIQVDFLDFLPPRVAYKGILQLLDSPLDISHLGREGGDGESIIQHLDGCDSACESCFQLVHCSVAREILGSEWALAVAEAGINPSWVALFDQHPARNQGYSDTP